MSVWVVVVAAGSGRRFGAPKQFARLGGRALLEWSVHAARSVASGVVLVLPAPGPGDEPVDGGVRSGADPPGPADVIVTGGATRAESVRAGLTAVPSSAEVIVVHDGVRPLASAALFKTVVDAVLGGADAAIPATAVADTLKRVEADVVTSTVPRQDLVAVQTPQAFRAEVLRRAHRGAADASDDASLVEALGVRVRVVPGEARNIKVTTAADLEIAQALVRL